MTDPLTKRRLTHDRRYVAQYYAKERRDLLAAALQHWRVLQDGAKNG